MAVLVVGSVGSVISGWSMQDASVRSAADRFRHLSERLRAETARRFEIPRVELEALRGLFRASRSVERDEFRTFFASEHSAADRGGAFELGFIARIPRGELEEFVSRERADGAPHFVVHGGGGGPDSYPIRFVQPEPGNSALLGYDIGAVPEGRAAAERAMLDGELVLSEGVNALPGAGEHPSHLCFLPVYRTGEPRSTPQQRRTALLGWGFVVLALDRTLADVTGSVGHRLTLEIFDVGDGSTPAAGNPVHGGNLVHGEGTLPGSSRFEDRSVLEVGGRRWVLRVRSLPEFESGLERGGMTVGIAGVVISLLLATLVWGLGSGRVRAITLANEMTGALRASESEARTALATLDAFRAALDEQAIIASTDRSGRITDVNAKFCQISGYRREELLGQDHRILNSGLHSKPFWTGMWNTVTQGGVWRGEVCNRAKDGSLYWVDTAIGPLRDAGGAIIGYIAARQDITRSKRGEAALRRTLQVQEEMGRVARVGGWELDAATNRVTWTREIYRIFELPESFEPTLESALSFFPDDARTIVQGHVERAVASGTSFDYIVPFTTATGRQLWVRGLGKAERTGDGTMRVYGAFQDVTEWHDKKVELAMARDSADAANRAKSQFLTNMSHEIRTPMTAILGYLDLLGDEPAALDAAQRREFTRAIHAAGEHLLGIVKGILDLSKLESGTMTVERRAVSLEALLSGVESIVRPAALAKGIDLKRRVDPALPDRVSIDPARLTQILLNLVGNAVKFTPAGSVTIVAGMEATADSRRLVIDVEDTGIGIAPEQSTRLFTPFTQADDSMTRQYQGAGLGLVISRQLARLFGGEVTLVRTVQGEGSCFRVGLPLDAAAGRTREVAAASDRFSAHASVREPATTLRGRILIAEDTPLNQRLLARILRRAGAAVEVADHGGIALAMLEEADRVGQPFDLLLTDMQMPEMDGYALARTLRERGSKLPIIAVTAHVMAGDRERCLAAGCDDYCRKPLDRAELLAACARWCAAGRELDAPRAV